MAESIPPNKNLIRPRTGPAPVPAPKTGPRFINAGDRAVLVYNEQKRDVWVFPASEKAGNTDPSKMFEVQGEWYTRFAGEGQPLTLFRPPVAKASSVGGVASKQATGGGKLPVGSNTGVVGAGAPNADLSAGGVVEPSGAAQDSGADDSGVSSGAGLGGASLASEKASGSGKPNKLS